MSKDFKKLQEKYRNACEERDKLKLLQEHKDFKVKFRELVQILSNLDAEEDLPLAIKAGLFPLPRFHTTLSLVEKIKNSENEELLNLDLKDYDNVSRYILRVLNAMKYSKYRIKEPCVLLVLDYKDGKSVIFIADKHYLDTDDFAFELRILYTHQEPDLHHHTAALSGYLSELTIQDMHQLQKYLAPLFEITDPIIAKYKEFSAKIERLEAENLANRLRLAKHVPGFCDSPEQVLEIGEKLMEGDSFTIEGYAPEYVPEEEVLDLMGMDEFGVLEQSLEEDDLESSKRFVSSYLLSLENKKLQR